MGLFKFIAGTAGVVGAVVFAPVVLPAAAAVGATAIATAGTAAAAVGATAGTAVAAAGAAATAVGATAGTITAAVGTATAAGASAIAGTAAGSAAIAGMGAVGTGVASAAGAVGLSSVAAVAGTTTGATALGTITTGTVLGAGSALSGAGKMLEAEEVKDKADYKLNRTKAAFDMAEKSMNQSLEQLGEVKKKIWVELDSFIEVISKVKNVPEHEELSVDGSIKFDKMDMIHMRNISIALNDAIVGGVASLTGGSLVGFATASGLTSVATASTGAAIAGLHGAAATNASLAALGGGTLKLGGLGIAGGTIVMNALAFAPAVAIGGLMVGKEGTKQLESAKNYSATVEAHVEEVKSTIKTMDKLHDLAQKMEAALNKIEEVFNTYFEYVNQMTGRTTDFRNFTKKEQHDFFVSVKLGKILTDLTLTELFEENKETGGKVKTEEVEKAIQINQDEFYKVC